MSPYVCLCQYWSFCFVIFLAEAVNNMCGLGFNGFDANGKAKWDGITNVNILKVEVLTPNCLMQFSMEAC